MANANGFKAQYKTSSGSAWQTATSGTEMSCLNRLQQLSTRYPFSRVIDSDGRVVS